MPPRRKEPHVFRTCSALAPHLPPTCAALVPHLCRTCAALVPHLCAAMWADRRRGVLWAHIINCTSFYVNQAASAPDLARAQTAPYHCRRPPRAPASAAATRVPLRPLPPPCACLAPLIHSSSTLMPAALTTLTVNLGCEIRKRTESSALHLRMISSPSSSDRSGRRAEVHTQTDRPRPARTREPPHPENPRAVRASSRRGVERQAGGCIKNTRTHMHTSGGAAPAHHASPGGCHRTESDEEEGRLGGLGR